MESTKIVIAVYPGVTHLDFTGPHQFLSRVPGATVTVASVGGSPVTADGLTFASLEDLTEIQRCDILVVPGGSDVNAIRDSAFMEAIGRLAGSARYVVSVCTGSLILGAAGLLHGKRAASHWAWRDVLSLYGATPDERRVVRDGNVFTGGGVTAGIDVALTVISEIFGTELAQSLQLALEYAPAPPFQSGRPESAAPAILEQVRSRYAARVAGSRRLAEELAAHVAPRSASSSPQ